MFPFCFHVIILCLNVWKHINLSIWRCPGNQRWVNEDVRDINKVHNRTIIGGPWQGHHFISSEHKSTLRIAEFCCLFVVNYWLSFFCVTLIPVFSWTKRHFKLFLQRSIGFGWQLNRPYSIFVRINFNKNLVPSLVMLTQKLYPIIMALYQPFYTGHPGSSWVWSWMVWKQLPWQLNAYTWKIVLKHNSRSKQILSWL